MPGPHEQNALMLWKGSTSVLLFRHVFQFPGGQGNIGLPYFPSNCKIKLPSHWERNISIKIWSAWSNNTRSQGTTIPHPAKLRPPTHLPRERRGTQAIRGLHCAQTQFAAPRHPRGTLTAWQRRGAALETKQQTNKRQGKQPEQAGRCIPNWGTALRPRAESHTAGGEPRAAAAGAAARGLERKPPTSAGGSSETPGFPESSERRTMEKAHRLGLGRQVQSQGAVPLVPPAALFPLWAL